jgi:hypothetical protein
MAKCDYKVSEASLNKNVVKWLNSLEECFAFKVHGSSHNPGHLDVSGCLGGIRIELEGKVGNNKPSKLQWKYIHIWEECGAITGWYNTLEGAKEIVENHFRIIGLKHVSGGDTQ